MNKIVYREALAPNVKKFIVSSPQIAKKAQPGQFVVLIVDEKGERIPLTVVDTDTARGTITLIFQEVGRGTCRLGNLQVDDTVLHLLGPLGKATEIRKMGSVVTVGGGVGIAEVYPVTRAFKKAGNKVITIIGARNKDLLILEQEIKKVSDKLYISTDDGSYGRKGFVSDVLKAVLAGTKIDLVYAVGPVPMMRVVSELTRPAKVKTMVSLNPIMVDATGMCGSCRVCVEGKTAFACVEGPEFDAHLVDFTELEKRLNQFSEQEKTVKEYPR